MPNKNSLTVQAFEAFARIAPFAMRLRQKPHPPSASSLQSYNGEYVTDDHQQAYLKRTRPA